jgi:AraC-like DNA-binding protein
MNKHERLRAEIFSAAPGLAVSEQLFDAVDDAVFCIKNRALQYVAVNTAFVARARMRSKESLLGRTAREIFPPALAAGYEQQDAKVFATGTGIHDKLEMVTTLDGSAGWYLAQKVPVRDSRGRIVALAGVSRDLRAPVTGNPQFAAVAVAIRRMQEDYAQALRVEELARGAGLSLSSFERRVREVLHLSPRQFLTKTRIEAAAEALRSGTQPVARIALEHGFYDQAQFCRQFHHATGLTPSSYRAAHSNPAAV